jgi:hypothetical protein
MSSHLSGCDAGDDCFPGSFPRDREREERARARTAVQLPVVIQAASTGHSDPAVELADAYSLPSSDVTQNGTPLSGGGAERRESPWDRLLSSS